DVRPALDREVTAHPPRVAAADGEAEAAPARPLAGVELFERLEHPRHVLRGDADPRVRSGDLDEDRAVGAYVGRCLEADRTPHRELEGVAREVDEDLPHLCAVAEKRTRQLR